MKYFQVDLITVQEVRDNKKCINSMTYLKYKFKDNQFALCYGKKFKLECLLLKGINQFFYKNMHI